MIHRFIECLPCAVVARREIAVSGVAVGGKELAGNGRVSNPSLYNPSKSEDAAAETTRTMDSKLRVREGSGSNW